MYLAFSSSLDWSYVFFLVFLVQDSEEGSGIDLEIGGEEVCVEKDKDDLHVVEEEVDDGV